MSEDQSPHHADDSTDRRGLKFRRRDDHAINLFHEALANLTDIRRVDRILLDIGKLYDPLVGGVLVDLATRRQIMECLNDGRLDQARALIEARLSAYTKFDPSPEGGA